MKKAALYFLSSLLVYSLPGQAYECTGKVKSLVINPAGIITLSFGNINAVYLCSVSSSYNGVTPEACKAMLSILMSAKLSDKNVQLFFNDTANDCSNAAHPAWADLKNWYYGPALL